MSRRDNTSEQERIIRSLFKTYGSHYTASITQDPSESDKAYNNRRGVPTAGQLAEIRSLLQDPESEYYDDSYNLSDVIDYLLNRNPKYGMYFGVRYGSQHLYKICREKVINSTHRHSMNSIYEKALLLSIESGILKMFILCYKDIQTNQKPTEVNALLLKWCPIAPKLNHMEIVKYFVQYKLGDLVKMLQEGAAFNTISTEPFIYLLDELKRRSRSRSRSRTTVKNHIVNILNEILRSPSEKVSDAIIDLLIKEGANDYDAGLILCARMNSDKGIIFAKQFIRNGAKSFSKALAAAATSLDEAFIKMVKDLAYAKKIDFSTDEFTAALNDALKDKYMSEETLFMLDKYVNDYEEALLRCTRFPTTVSKALAKKYIENGAKNRNVLWKWAAKNFNHHILELFTESFDPLDEYDIRVAFLTTIAKHGEKIEKGESLSDGVYAHIEAILTLLIHYGADMNEGIVSAIDHADEYMVMKLLEYGADLNDAIVFASFSPSTNVNILRTLLDKDDFIKNNWKHENYVNLIIHMRKYIADINAESLRRMERRRRNGKNIFADEDDDLDDIEEEYEEEDLEDEDDDDDED